MGTLPSFRALAFTGSLATLALLFGCGGGSSSSGSGVTPSATPNVNLAITDAPSDNWQEVSVVLESASLIPQGSSTPVQIWPPSGSTSTTPTVVNLVDLSNVATLLGSVAVPAGTYSTLQFVINTDPTTMTLVDDNGNTIPSADLTVKGSGTLNVALSPAFTVAATGTTTLQADFDLADPLSIVETTLGGNTQVTLDLQVHFKALPANVKDLQFTRKLGQVTGTDTANGFTITDASGNAFTYEVDANTWYWDADTQAAGSFSGVVNPAYALVDANLNADGTYYARRVWYAAAASTLPTRTPEGLVRRVNTNNNTFKIYAPAVTATAKNNGWMLQTVTVDANTVWTFKTTVAMGTGTSYLADIWRGCRVDVTLDATSGDAATVNVESAYDEGFIGSATTSALTFGFPSMAMNPPPMAVGLTCGLGDLAPRSYAYYENANDATNAFSWWYFGLPSSADSAAADLVSVFTASRTAKLPVTGYAALYWDVTQATPTWSVYRLILEPEQLNTSVISTAYVDGGSGSGTMGVTCLNPWANFASAVSGPVTVTLDYTGDLQTVVASASYTQATNTFTYTIPVPSADWSTLLVPPAAGTFSLDQIWVRPVLDGTTTPATIDWTAYTVQQFTWQ